jgi:ribA/ribD-fused uncharacterized protein
MNNPITSFTGEFRFLSNFWVCSNSFQYRGRNWITTEQAYQAAKLKPEHEHLADLMDDDKISPSKAKRIGKEIDIREDWNVVRLAVMININRLKYENNPDLMQMLLDTKGRELIEGNNWGDTFWGQSPLGNGRNELGKILMGIRDSFLN